MILNVQIIPEGMSCMYRRQPEKVRESLIARKNKSGSPVGVLFIFAAHR